MGIPPEAVLDISIASLYPAMEIDVLGTISIINIIGISIWEAKAEASAPGRPNRCAASSYWEVQVEWLKMSPEEAESDEKKAHEIYAKCIDLDELPNFHI